MTNRNAVVGLSVHFVPHSEDPEAGHHLGAIVASVLPKEREDPDDKDDRGRCNLTVFLPSGMTRAEHDVPFRAEPASRSWHWLEDGLGEKAARKEETEGVESVGVDPDPRSPIRSAVNIKEHEVARDERKAALSVKDRAGVSDAEIHAAAEAERAHARQELAAKDEESHADPKPRPVREPMPDPPRDFEIKGSAHELPPSPRPAQPTPSPAAHPSQPSTPPQPPPVGGASHF